jgi:RES domain-containing protein
MSNSATLTSIRRDDTHRLIPSRYVDGGNSVLARLVDDEQELSDVFELDGATNDRLLGEAGLLPGITVHELVFGVRDAHIVNAAFTHASPIGGRFNGPDRGAWYAAFERHTAEEEVRFHKLEELREVNWRESEVATYVDFLADFRAEFHDIRNDSQYAECLSPTSYAESQAFARELLQSGSSGLVYPSVRCADGICLACFRPTLVMNVRRGEQLSFTLTLN